MILKKNHHSGITMAMKIKRSKPRRLGNTQYKVENWAEYNEAFRCRGDITLWISEDLLDNWHPKKSGHRGRPKAYSGTAIESCLKIRQVYHLPLRHTEGLIRSLIRLMDSPITAPDYTTLSKRSLSLELVDLAETIEPGSHMILDSTGLKVYGRDEWHQEKHAVDARRIWRKLHLAINENHYITASDLTNNSIGDASVVSTLLEQVSNVDTVMADGAYDGEPTYQKLNGKNENVTVIIHRPKTPL
jgi:Transposase DDE domain